MIWYFPDVTCLSQILNETRDHILTFNLNETVFDTEQFFRNFKEQIIKSVSA